MTSWRGPALAAFAGAALTLAFAPFGWWWLTLLLPALQWWLWLDVTPRVAAWRGLWFGAGQFGAGTYWLYISIHGFGQAPVWLALLLMVLLVAIMSSYQALLGWMTVRWRPRSLAWFALAWAPALWTLVEWVRGWFLSGFSWLSLGYAHTDSPFGGFAPLVGMYGVGFLCLVAAGGLLLGAVTGTAARRALALAATVAAVAGGQALRAAPWAAPAGAPVAVAIVQGAIPQDEKWQASNRRATLDRYRELTRSAHGTPLIVWPEAAAPDLVNNLGRYFSLVYDEAQAAGSALVMGALRADDAQRHYYNSVLALDRGVRWYDKHHLVPFAEFFPVPKFVRNWLRLMSLPYSDFDRGAADQAPLPAAGLLLSASVCYEDAYATTQLPALATATALVNVTNDAWFGESTARHQHLQISRLRAMEARRYLVRAANDGVSAVIDPFGQVVARAPEGTPTVLRSAITPWTGLTPFARMGNFAAVGCCGILLLATLGWRRHELLRTTKV